MFDSLHLPDIFESLSLFGLLGSYFKFLVVVTLVVEDPSLGPTPVAGDVVLEVELPAVLTDPGPGHGLAAPVTVAVETAGPVESGTARAGTDPVASPGGPAGSPGAGQVVRQVGVQLTLVAGPGPGPR